MYEKLSAIILFLVIITGMFAGCKRNVCDSYDVSSSSVQGITVSPELKTNDKSLQVQYYWSITEGAFVDTSVYTVKK